MRAPWALAVLCVPAFGQFESIELRFEGVGCASCIESMPARVKRMRGVESADVDAAKGTLSIRLGSTNRVRLDQVRDAIQQDGTKVKSARVLLRGAVSREAGKWTVQPVEGGARYAIEGPSGAAWKEGAAYRIEGEIESPAPGATLKAVSAAPLP